MICLYLFLISNKFQEEEGFEWDENQQNLVLGAFYWVNWLMQVPGGVLAHKYGTKTVFGLFNFAAVLCCFIIPAASHLHYSAAIAVRCLQGLFSVSLEFSSYFFMAFKTIVTIVV